jgi:hypothetical protein
MKYWFFGASSEYAQYVIEDLENAGHEVIKFGRHNVDYNNPEEFIDSIKTLPLPDRVFFNANIQGYDFDYSRNIIDQREVYEDFISSWKVGFWFKLVLLKYLEDKMNGVFIFSTSTIAYDNSTFPNTILYRILRGSEQQLIFTVGGKNKNLIVAGCCVSDMSLTTKKKYAKVVSKHLLNDGFNDNHIWSVVGDNDDKQMYKVIMDWKQHSLFMDNGFYYDKII